jgi:protein SCO1/2
MGLMRWGLAFAALAWLLAIAAPAPAEDWRIAAIGKSQDAIGKLTPDIALTGADGGRVTLAQFRGKPLLVSLVYTGCADICPTVIENLAAASRAAEETFGKGSFNILTVGFDTRRDTPDRMRSFARTHRAGGENWLFASADAATLDRLAAAVGFDFAASAGGFDHPAQVTVVDDEGRVFSQIYGGAFAPPAVVEPLKSLIYGGARPIFSLAGLSDRIKLICTVYDPRTGRYYFDYSIILSVFIGASFLAGVFHFLLRELRKSARAGRV